MVKDLNPPLQLTAYKLLVQRMAIHRSNCQGNIPENTCLLKRKVATPDKTEEWDHLKTISSEITQTNVVEVGLLINTNCMRALEHVKVIASNSGRPYAYQTCLGWCIVGLISIMVGKDSIGCHRIAVQNARSSNIADCHFVVVESMKDSSLEEMFQKMHQNDSVEKQVISVNGLLENMVEIFKDDKAFLKNQLSSLVTITLYHSHLKKKI